MREVRPIRKLDRRGHISFSCRRQNREVPLFVLNLRGHTDIRTNPEISPRASICERSAERNELLADLLVPKIELQFVLGRKPVGCPAFSTLTLSTDPATHQIPSICVSIAI